MRSLYPSLVLALWAGLAQAAGPVDLLQLYEQTLATNPVLKGKEYTIDQAHAQRDQALSKLLPQVMAVGNYSWNEFRQDRGSRFPGYTVDGYAGMRGVIQARQALFDLPSYLGYQSAGASIQQTEQELEAVRMATTADLIDRYFMVLEAVDEMSYVEGEKALTTSEMQRIRRMYERQMAMVTDLYEVEAYYQTLLTREIEVGNAKAVALEKLRETTGMPVPDLAPLARDRLPEVPGQVDEWVREANTNHPALKALQYALDAAETAIGSARAQHLPQLSLQLSEIYSDNQGYDNRPIGRYNSASVGVQLNVPIYSGGEIEAAAKEAVARYQTTQEKRVERQREIDKEVRTAYLNARTGRAKVDSTAKEIEFREKARVAQEKSYELGVATIVALLESKKNLLKARFEYAGARYDYIRSLVALRLWSGSLSLRDIEDINGWLAGAKPKR
ncbi:outer membrane protein [Methylomagnum ishizawai]|uniref:Outer membrane protein n=1 Tax=Methylomagnum ishizawai TaxID=1760988 RepID=A0A1Y6D184_9GAMM|nr:TolC family protein [Methylomagnum ishizawai]SMF96688.1 outer membrane protein [Methylomagnum ishizawai]